MSSELVNHNEVSHPLAYRMIQDNHFGVGVIYCSGFELIVGNQKFSRFLGLHADEMKSMVGKNVLLLIHKEIRDAIQDCFVQAIHSGESVFHREFCCKPDDSPASYWDACFIPLKEQGALKYLAILLEDVSDRVRERLERESETELRLMLEKSLAMKDEYLSVVAHELKTPLTVINSAVQAIEVICRDELSSRMTGFLKKIKQNSLKQLRLVNNLLDLTRGNAGRLKLNLKNHDIVFHTRVIMESVQLFAEQKGIKLHFSTTVGLKVMALDEEKYERILLNLLSNAIKFTQSGGEIEVSISVSERQVTLAVSDNGIGIPKEKHSYIFERFGQVDSSLSQRAEGTGIGLSLVKMLVEVMGGCIRVKSKLGRGSTFSVKLPSLVLSENLMVETPGELIDSRLVQSIAIEFSDIYF